MTWNDQFLALFRSCVEKYRSGNSDFMSYYSAEDLEFLKSIGYKPRELFDFVEDLVDESTPSESTALLVASVRRDYFLTMQQGKLSTKEISSSDLPTFGDTLEGIAYFPRILAKARAKLKGELNPDMMYSCGGDRNFLNKNGNIPPADFLRHVWASGDDDQHIIDFVKSQNS
ncbi:MAG: DUF5069 domain-containing protein [Akkermansiaceae bacterium]